MSRDATAVIKASSRSSSTLAIGAKRKTMSYRLTIALALVFLVSGLWPQMVTSAPTPQQQDAGALAGLLDADSLASAGRDDGNSDGATEFSLINGNKRLTPTSAIAAVQNAPSEVEDTTEMFMPQLTNPSIIRSAILSSSLSSSPVPPTSSATLTYTLLNRSRTPMIFSSVSSSSSSTSTTPPKPQRSAAVVVNLRPIPSTTSTTIRPSVPNSTDKTNPTKIQTKNNTLQEPTTTAKSVLLTGLNQTSSNVTWIANNKLTSQLVTSNATPFDDADYEYYDYDETTLQKTSQSTTAIAKSTTKTLTSTARAITSPPVQVTTLTLRQDLVRQATTATTIATTTTLTPFLTTSTAAPNVGILNGLTRAGGAGISIGIASAAYAAIALFGIPFIGRRRRSINERNWLFASDYNPGYRRQWLEVVDN